MSNPTKLSWVGPTQNTDGSAFGASDQAGFNVLIDNQPAVSLPLAWATDNKYQVTFAELTLSYGAHTARVQTVAKNGQVSAPSNAVDFTVVDERVPKSPLALAAA